MKSPSAAPDNLPEDAELFSITTLAEALGICHASAWGRVQEALAASAARQPVAGHLQPARWIRKGQRREVFFTADQIAAARRARGFEDEN